MSKPFFTTLFHFDHFYRFALIRFTFFIALPDSVFVKEVNISMLDTVIAILIRLFNSTLSYYVNILKLICISSIPFSISRVWLQTELDSKKSYYQLIKKSTICEKRSITKLWKKEKICIKILTKELVFLWWLKPRL